MVKRKFTSAMSSMSTLKLFQKIASIPTAITRLEAPNSAFAESPTSGNDQFHLIHKPLIIIIGITEYDDPYQNLDVTPRHIENMKHLWLNIYKYDPKYVSIISGGEDKSGYITQQQLHISLNHIKETFSSEQYVDCDGLIIINFSYFVRFSKLS